MTIVKKRWSFFIQDNEKSNAFRYSISYFKQMRSS